MAAKFAGSLRVLQKINKYEFAFEADILRDGRVQNGKWEFRNLEANYKTFAGRPVLIAYIGNKVGDGHNAQDKLDPKTGEPYRSFTASTAERIVGMISEDEKDLTLFERDGHTWVRVKGRIWSYYAPELVDKLTRTGRMDVSIEASVSEERKEGDVEVYDVWVGLGLTILGDNVNPAVPGASIRALAAMQEEFESMKLRVASLVEEESNKPQNNSDETGVKKSMRLSKQQLRELQAKFGDKLTVLAAEKCDAGVRVCLLTEEGATATYLMGSLEEAVVPERVSVCNAQTAFAFGEEIVNVDAGDLVERMGEQVKTMSAELEKAKADLAEKTTTVENMVNAENARRLAAAKKMATDTLDAFNANREEKVDAKCLEALGKDIEAGKFTACMGEDGAWNGDKLVEEKVKALCADAVMALDKKLSDKKAEPKAMTWGTVRKAQAAPGTVGELFASQN